MKGGNEENGRFSKLWRFSRNEFWKNIVCILSTPTFVLEGSRLWEKDLKKSGKKKKRSLI